MESLVLLNTITNKKDHAKTNLSNHLLVHDPLTYDRNMRVCYSNGTITTDTYIILVQLNNASFPHQQTNYICIDQTNIDLIYTSGNNNETNIFIGVITDINGTDADITYYSKHIFGSASPKNSTNFIINYQPSSLKMQVISNVAQNVATSNTETAITAVNTGITLDSPVGSITPAIGDIILKFDHITGDYDPAINILYHSE